SGSWTITSATASRRAWPTDQTRAPRSARRPKRSSDSCEPDMSHDNEHEGHGGHGGLGDHAAMFRDRFWLTLALTVPVVLFSHMFQRVLGYTAPTFVGSDWVSPGLGTIIFLYGGWPFLTGAVSEIRLRQPGMMLLIGLAITVAFVA